MKTSAGSAAQLIDFGYAVKLPLCKLVDSALGVSESHPFSLTRFLDMCYEARRPQFVLADVLFAPFTSR